MAAKLAAVDPRPPARSPERERLAAAVAALREAEAARQRVEGAKAALPDLIEALQAVDAAKDAIRESKKSRAAWLTSRILGEGDGSEDPFLVAESALRDAESHLETTREQCELLDQRAAEIASAIAFKESAIRDGVAAVLRADPAVSRVAEELERLEARSTELRKILSAVSQRNGIPDQHRFWNAMRPHLIPADASMRHLQEWASALHRLETGDADAALPEFHDCIAADDGPAAA